MGARITGGGNTSISSSVDRGDTPASKNRRSSSTTPTSSSKPTIKPMTEEEIKANQLISSSVDRANGIDRTKEAMEKAKQEASTNSPNQSLPSTLPTPPNDNTIYPEDDFRAHIDPDNSLVGTIRRKYNAFREQTLMENVESGINSQLESGKEKANDVDVSGFSQTLMDTGNKIEEKAEEYKQLAKIIHPTDAMQGEIVPSTFKSISSIASMFSRVPAGAEIAVQEPSLIPNAVAVAALGTVDYTVKTAKNDPVQLVSDIAVFSALGAGVGRAGTSIKSRVPAITTGEQGFLLKTKIPETPITPDPIVNPTTVAELKASAFGKDFYKLSEVNNEVVVPKSQPNGMNALIGETKNGFTDVYFKLNENQARQLSKQFSGDLQNIKTPEGSFISFEPTGKIMKEGFTASESKRISTSIPELIGELSSHSPSRTNPIRIEKRTNLIKGELEISQNSQLALAEATRTMESTIIETPKELNSGLVKGQKNIFKDTSGELLPKNQYMQKEAFIGEMQRMNTKVERKPCLAFKESNPIDTGFKEMFEQATTRNDALVTKITENNIVDPKFKEMFEKATSKEASHSNKFNLKRSPQPKGRNMPLVFGSPGIKQNIINKNLEIADVSPTPRSKTESFTVTPSSSKTTVTTKNEKTAISNFGMGKPIGKVPNLEFSSKKKKKVVSENNKNDDYKYKRTTNKYKSPLDVKIKRLI